MHRLSNRLSIGSCLLGPCARHCCYGSCINGKEGRRGWMRSTSERPTPIGTINSVPSAPSPGGRHLFPAPGAAGRGLAASRPPRASYRSAPERVSSHAASFGHMMPGPSGPTTMSTWPSVPPETVTASRSAFETTSSRASSDSEVQGHRQCGPGRGPGRSARHQPRRHRSGVHRERACWPGPGP
jgi:hypothetical protein